MHGMKKKLVGMGLAVMMAVSCVFATLGPPAMAADAPEGPPVPAAGEPSPSLESAPSGNPGEGDGSAPLPSPNTALPAAEGQAASAPADDADALDGEFPTVYSANVSLSGDPDHKAVHGGGLAAGTELVLDLLYTPEPSGHTLTTYYTTDGSDPSDPGNGAVHEIAPHSGGAPPQTVPVSGYMNLRVAYEWDHSGERILTSIDQVYHETYENTPYISAADLCEAFPELYPVAAPGLKSGLYRLEGDDPGVRDTAYGGTGKGWEVVGYDTPGLPGALASNRRSGEKLARFTSPGSGQPASFKSDRTSLYYEQGDSDGALVFWMWTDGTYDENDGITVTLFDSTGGEVDVPVLFTAKSDAPGWKQVFVSTAGTAAPDVNQMCRFGFILTSRGDHPLYVDDIGAAAMLVESPSYDGPAPGDLCYYDTKASYTAAAGNLFSIVKGDQADGYLTDKEVSSAASLDTWETGCGSEAWYAAGVPQAADGSRGCCFFAAAGQAASTEPLLKGLPPDQADEMVPGRLLELTSEEWEASPPLAGTIWYTTDENDVLDKQGNPLPGAQKYIAPFPFTGKRMILKAAACIDGLLPSKTANFEHSLPKEQPVSASLPSGTVAPGVQVALSCANPDASIYYTTDGTVPAYGRGGQFLYTGPITVEDDVVIRAVAVGDATSESDVATFRYSLPADGDIFEPNNTLQSATPLSFPFRVEATLHYAGDVDLYAFDFPGGQADFSLLQPDNASVRQSPYRLALLSSGGEVLSEGTGLVDQAILRQAEAGRYYLRVQSADGAEESAMQAKEPYTLSASRIAGAGEELDFSELNMVTGMLHPNSPMAYSFPNTMDNGGNFFYTMAYLARWSGPVLESEDPYHCETRPCPSDPDRMEFDPEQMAYQSISPAYHLQQASYTFDEDTDVLRQKIKNMVYTHGGVDVIYNHVNDALNGMYYYNPPGTAGIGGGHLVTIVGWDDDLPAENFTVSIGGRDYTPDGPGGWIVKNSWSTYFGDEGYYYASYYAVDFPFASEPAGYILLESNVDYNTVYQYDLLGITDQAYLPYKSNALYQKNIFTAAASERLRAVGFYLYDEGCSYDVYLEQNGERRHLAGGVKAEAGYYTLRLSEDIPLAADEDFAIIVYTERPEGPALLPMEYWSPTTPKVQVQHGRCFYSADGENWQDAGTDGCNLCVKAFTYSDAVPSGNVAYRGADQPEAAAPVGESFPVMDAARAAPSFGGTKSPLKGMPMATLPPADFDLPARFDLRELGAVSSVKNQGQLGACWAFAAYGSAESVLKRSGNIAYAYPSSVSLSRNAATLDITDGEQDFSLTATVDAPGLVGTNAVYWSFDGDLDSVDIKAASSESGEQASLLRAKGTGTITVTATSAADTSKSAGMTLTVVDNSAVPGMEGKTLVCPASLVPADGQLSADEWDKVLEAIEKLLPGEALLLRIRGEVLVPGRVFEAIREAGATVGFQQTGVNGEPYLNAVFDGAAITSPADFRLGAVYAASDAAAKAADAAFGPQAAMQPVQYAHSGGLPGPATFSIPRRLTPFKDGQAGLQSYYYNPASGRFEAAAGVGVLVSGQYVRLNGLTHCSEYVITDAPLPAAPAGGGTDDVPGAAGGADTATTPRTGDPSNFWLQLALACAAGAALFAALCRRKQRG